MKRLVAFVTGIGFAALISMGSPGCDCHPLPETVSIDPGMYELVSNTDGGTSGYEGYRLAITGNDSGTLATIEESFTLNGVKHVYRYQVYNHIHISVTR